MWLAAITGVAILANLPFLAVRGLFADDWSWFHLYWTEGPASVMRAMVEAAHGAYGPWFVLAFGAGAEAGRVARWVAFALHLANAWLLFRLLRRPVLTRRVAPLAAAIFLVSPFYTARGMLAHTQYDLFLFCWLLSVAWMAARARWQRIAAPVAMAVAMGFEPLMLLEPLRALHAWQNERRWPALARRLAPFWAIAAITALLRFTLLKPHGHWEGFRAVSFAPGPLAEHMALGLGHAPAAVALAAWEAAYALPWWLLAIVVAAAGFACWRGIGGAPRSARDRRGTLIALNLALALVALGTLPYALSGDHPWPTRFESRFFFVQNVGAVIGVAALIVALPRAWLRRAAAWAALTLFALGTLGDGKWLLLDERIQSAVQVGFMPELTDPAAPKLVRLRIEPASNRTLYRFRCLGAGELNVAADLLRPAGAPKSFMYETLCGDWDKLAPAACSITYVDRHRCPSRIEDRVFQIPDSLNWKLAGWRARRADEELTPGTIACMRRLGPDTRDGCGR